MLRTLRRDETSRGEKQYFHMTPGDIWELREAQPFVPFRICLTDGKRYDVPHRDCLMISRTVIDIGVASQPKGGIYDQIIRVSPLHIVRVENLQEA